MFRLAVTIWIGLFAALACGCGQAATAAGGSPTHSTASTVTTSPPSTTTSSSAPAALSNTALKSTTERLIAAYNQKNAQAVCSSLTPQTMAWMTRLLHEVFGADNATCEQFVGLPFHPQTSEDSDTSPAFRHVAVLQWLGFDRVGGFGEATTLLQARFPGVSLHTSMSNPQVVTFWYADLDGKLLLARMPPIGQVLQGTDPDPSDNLAPLTPAERAVPASVGTPRFGCSGAAQSSPDASNDVLSGDGPPITHAVAPWLDIRRVTGVGVTGKQPCLEIELAAPLRPGTEITVDGNSFVPTIVAFDSQDDYATGFGGFRENVIHMVGERGSTVVLALDAAKPPWTQPFDKWSVCISQVRAFDPLSYSIHDTFDRWTPGDPTADNGTAGTCT